MFLLYTPNLSDQKTKKCIYYFTTFTTKESVMFESISEETQLILVLIGIALLFFVVRWNSARNKRKLYNRDKRDFRKNYFKKKNK